MANLKDITFLELLPPNLRGDPDAIAASAALDKESKNFINSVNKAIIFADFDSIDEKTADLLATDLHLEYYSEDFDIHTKRKLVKESLNWHRKKGTVKTLEDILQTVVGDTRVQEWFDYGGRPHHFKVVLATYSGVLTQSVLDKINDVVEKYKRLSSRLDNITVSGGKGGALKYGIAIRYGIKVTIKK